MSEQQLDSPDRRVKSLVYTGIARAYLGYVPVNDEFANVCLECGGDGCPQCKFTGEAS